MPARRTLWESAERCLVGPRALIDCAGASLPACGLPPEWTLQLGGRGTPDSQLLMKLAGSLRLSGHHHEGQIELFVKSGNQIGPGGIQYDYLMLIFYCGQLPQQLLIGRHFLEQSKQTREIHMKNTNASLS